MKPYMTEQFLPQDEIRLQTREELAALVIFQSRRIELLVIVCFMLAVTVVVLAIIAD